MGGDGCDGDTKASPKAKGKARAGAKRGTTKGSSACASGVARAEIISPDSFAIFLEEPQAQPWTRETRAAIVLELEAAAQAADESVQTSFAESDRCELDASSYLSIHHALVAGGRMAIKGSFYWLPLPFWATDALPAFGGQDPNHPQPASVWLHAGLMPYQQTSVHRALAQGGRVLLADEMGLGKTAQALSIIAQYLNREGPALIITPPALGGVWKSQIKMWLPDVRSEEVQVVLDAQDRVFAEACLVIVSYNIFARKPKIFSSTHDGRPWQIVVCDEAHYLRNPTSQRSKSLLPVLQAARRVVLVTGTPTPKHASEAYTLLHALRPLQCTFKEWCSRYGTDRTERREAEVAALLAEVMVRRMKADVLEQLPPRRRQRIELHLPSGVAAAVRRLQDAVTDEEYFRQLAALKEAAAQEYVEYLLDASTQKFVLFGHHRAMLNSLDKILTKRGVDFIRIDGATPVIERAGLVRRFQTNPDCRVAVLSVLAAGEGLSFTAASVCVFCELCPAVPGVIEQAEARIHRIGQQASSVDIQFLIVDGTRDDRVYARLESRTDAIAQAVGDQGADEGIYAKMESGVLSEDHVAEAIAMECASRGVAAGQVSQTRKIADVGPGPRSGAPKKKRRKPGFDLGSVLDREITRAQADISDMPGVRDSMPCNGRAVNGHADTGHEKLQTEPITKRMPERAPALEVPLPTASPSVPFEIVPNVELPAVNVSSVDAPAQSSSGGARRGRGRLRRRVACSSDEDDVPISLSESATALQSATALESATTPQQSRFVLGGSSSAGALGASKPVVDTPESPEDTALSFFAASISKTAPHNRKHEHESPPLHGSTGSSGHCTDGLPADCLQSFAESEGDRQKSHAQGVADGHGSRSQEDPLAAMLDSLIDSARASF